MQQPKYPPIQRRSVKYHYLGADTKVPLTHPDNMKMSHSIYPEKLRFYEMAEREHMGNYIQTGRALFRILEIINYPEDKTWDKITVHIEYNPKFRGHIDNILLEIGFQWGYASAREYFTKNQKANETAY
jgi:hypothetical protein